MPVGILEAFIRLFADDTALRKTFADLPAAALRAGSEVGARFSEGTRKGFEAAVTPTRATQAHQLILPTVGGREVDVSSPFTKGSQQFRMEQEVARAIQSGATGPGGGLEIPAALGKFRDAMGQLPGANDRAAASFHGVREAARIFGSTIASEVNPMFGELVAASAHGARSMGALGAGIGATLAVVALYASHLKDATDFQVKLNLAAKSFDPAAAGALLQEAIAGLEKFQQLKREAAEGAGAVGGPPPFRAFFANLQLLFGAGVDELTKRARDAAAVTAKSFAEVTAPKQALQGEIDRLKLLAQAVGMDRAAAESSDALRASVEKLTEARTAQAEAEASLISRDRLAVIKELAAALEAVGDDSKAAAAAQAVATGKLADIDRRALQARQQGAQDVAQLQRDGIRDAGALAAAEITATEKIAATVSRRRDAIFAALKDMVEAQAQTSASLEAIFGARRQLEEASTQGALQDLVRESEARRAAARETFADRPIALERELTQITAEETTKRTEIAAKAVSERIALAQRETQELISRAQMFFQLQKDLGQATLQDELRRQTDIAQAAVAGSKVQLDAIAQVGKLVAQQAAEAKAFLSQALAASDALRQKAGIEPSAFVSGASLARDAATRARQLEEAQKTFTSGGAITREDFQALAGGQLKQFQDQQKAGAAALAQQSVDLGQSPEAFAAGLQGPGGRGAPFEAQLAQAFTPPEDMFKTTIGQRLSDQVDEAVAKATSSFTDLVTKGSESFQELMATAAAAFGNIEKLVAGTWDRIIAKTQDGTSQLGASITRMVEDTIARGLADAERRS